MSALEAIAADGLAAPGAAHAFFTRKGGASGGDYASLNCGRGARDDARENVEANRARAAAHLGVDAGALVSVRQIHSADAVAVDAPWRPEASPKADALVADRPGVALGVLTADCAPVLLIDARARVIGAAHAGWKGAVGGVIEATVALMTARGAARGRIRAVVGPCISQRAYEVGPEFVERFLDGNPDWNRFFAGAARAGHAMFDLPGFCLMRLREAGVGAAEWTGHCTYGDEARFYSYRRATHRGEPDYGRGLSAITLI